jgi:hypothetical protein
MPRLFFWISAFSRSAFSYSPGVRSKRL